MKKMGDIMKEMGFNKDASDSVKEAFVRHLIKAATGVTLPPRSENSQSSSSTTAQQMLYPRTQSQVVRDFLPKKLKTMESTQPVQLSFDFSQDQDPKTKKVS